MPQKKCQKEWYERNKKLANARSKEWYLKNRELCIKRARESELRMYNEPERLKRQREATARYRLTEKGKGTFFKAYLKRAYNITVDDYNKMCLDQGNLCAICYEPLFDNSGKKPHVDHSHSTGKIRGILCYKCNNGLGLFNDNIQKLRNAIEYLTNRGEQ